MKRPRLSWIPEGVFDPQGMTWHPFGLMRRRYDFGYESTWYWRRYYVSLINPIHPFFMRNMVAKNIRSGDWRGLRFWLGSLVRPGKD